MRLQPLPQDVLREGLLPYLALSGKSEHLSAAQRLGALRDTQALCCLERRTRGLVRECALGGIKGELLGTPGITVGGVAGRGYGEAAALLWRVLRLESGGPVRCVREVAAGHYVRALEVVGDVLVSGHFRTIKVYNTQSWERERTLEGHTNWV